jgi:hypothetical protein
MRFILLEWKAVVILLVLSSVAGYLFYIAFRRQERREICGVFAELDSSASMYRFRTDFGVFKIDQTRSCLDHERPGEPTQSIPFSKLQRLDYVYSEKIPNWAQYYLFSLNPLWDTFERFILSVVLTDGARLPIFMVGNPVKKVFFQPILAGAKRFQGDPEEYGASVVSTIQNAFRHLGVDLKLG